METFNFSTENFLKPSQKYINEWYDKTYITEMYNLDLINFVKNYKLNKQYNTDMPDFLYIFERYKKVYDFPSIETLTCLFSDYPEKDLKELYKFVVENF